MRRVDSSIVGVEAPEVGAVKAQREALAARVVRRGSAEGWVVVAESRDELGRLREREAEFVADFVAVI